MNAIAGLIGGGSILAVAISNGIFAANNTPASYVLLNTGVPWLVSGQVSQAECYAELTVGAVESGPINIWVPLSTSRVWTSNDCVFNLSIRQIGTTTTLATAQITLTSYYGDPFA